MVDYVKCGSYDDGKPVHVAGGIPFPIFSDPKPKTMSLKGERYCFLDSGVEFTFVDITPFLAALR